MKRVITHQRKGYLSENYNKSKKENPEEKQCPQEKVGYSKDALRYFEVINAEMRGDWK